MEKYMITGMSCAACQARIEKTVSGIEGVTSCSVNLLTNSMLVDGNVDNDTIIKAVENAGYGANLMDQSRDSLDSSYKNEEEALKDRETPVLKKRLITSIGFLLVLMYFSMGHMMFGFPLPAFLTNNHPLMGTIQMVLAIIIMVINRKFFISGFKGLFHGAPNMDTLVALGSGASFLYSFVSLVLMYVADAKGDSNAVMGYMHNFYFESAAMILTLITVGKMLEAISKGRTTNALKGLMKLAPKSATIIDEAGIEQVIPVEKLKINDIFVVRPGESIPVDGIIIEGNTSIDESSLTGESIPVDKTVNESVSAATINQEGFIKCRAVRVGRDTTLSQIIQMVSDAASTKAPIAKIADKISGIFVPSVMIIAAITFVIWFLLGKEFSFALSKAVAVLVISCPCALGLATPVAIMVGNGMAAKNGIMFKTAASLENLGRTQIVALDKTGTITKGEPVVTDILPADLFSSSGYFMSEPSDEALLEAAAMLESKSEHPLAKAIINYTNDLIMDVREGLTNFRSYPGNGLEGELDGIYYRGGNIRFIEKYVNIPEEIRERARTLALSGKTPLFFLRGKKLLGIIAVADTIKEDSAKAISELKKMGVHVVMLTGDNEGTAKAIASSAGVDEVVAGVLPEGKAQVIKKMSDFGKVAMVGDGINDAPALTVADTGIAIGAGTDVAIDAADVVLMKNSLLDVSGAIRLSRATLRNIHENLFWAFFYNVLCIPLAAGAYYHAFGWSLSPMIGAGAMSLSSFFVVMNALRLNLFDIRDTSRDKIVKNAINNKIVENINLNVKENIQMKKTMTIEGMMCGHCEATVKKALETIEGVSLAEVNHENGTAIVSLVSEVSDDVLRQAVEDKDYRVVGID